MCCHNSLLVRFMLLGHDLTVWWQYILLLVNSSIVILVERGPKIMLVSLCFDMFCRKRCCSLDLHGWIPGDALHQLLTPVLRAHPPHLAKSRFYLQAAVVRQRQVSPTRTLRLRTSICTGSLRWWSHFDCRDFMCAERHADLARLSSDILPAAAPTSF